MWHLELIALAMFLDSYVASTSTLKCPENQAEATQDGAEALVTFGGHLAALMVMVVYSTADSTHKGHHCSGCLLQAALSHPTCMLEHL